MGWLRTLMREAKPALSSFDALAQSLLAHNDWPSDSRLKQRSLSALLSKIDRGIELEWLADRTTVQHIAAELLGCPLASIQTKLSKRIIALDDSHQRFRFDDVRFARPLELLAESLPPGLPVRVQRPASWKHLWWQAPCGSGRSLVGKWLQARGLARYIVVHDARQASRILQDTAEPLFVEIAACTGVPLAIMPNLAVACCVAAEDPPTEQSWEMVRSPPPSDYLNDLCAWLATRLPKDGNFDPQRAGDWLRQSIPSELLDRFGVSLGLLGLIDEFGIDKLAGKPLEIVARAFVSHKLHSALERGNSEAQWLQERGFDALIGIACRALTESAVPWGSALNEGDWVKLVPQEYQQGVDAQWMKLMLSKSVSAAAARELDLAVSKLQPGAFRLVRALRSGGLLRASEQAGQLTLAPHWLAQTLKEIAVLRTVEGSAVEWGEALLFPHSAARIFPALQTQLAKENFSAIEDVLELDAGSSASQCAAVEACFRAAGLFLLVGGQLPNELLTALYEEQCDLIAQIGKGALPKPRIEYESSLSSADSSLQLGAFYLAALAISAELPERGVRRNALLHPFGETRADPRLGEMLSCVAQMLNTAPESLQRRRWYAATDRLLARLVEHFSRSDTKGTGNRISAVFLNANNQPHELEWPSLILREVRAGGMTQSWLDVLTQHPHLLERVKALCNHEAIDWAQIATQIWNLWQQAKASVTNLEFIFHSGQLLWPYAPPDALLFALNVALDDEQALLDVVPFDVLTADQWLFLAEAAPNVAPKLFISPKLWVHAPLEIAVSWLGNPNSEAHLQTAVPAVWQRSSSALLAQFELALKHPSSPPHTQFINGVLRFAAKDQTPELLPLLHTATLRPAAPVSLIDSAREFLHTQIRSRAHNFREAHTLFVELERRANRFAPPPRSGS